MLGRNDGSRNVINKRFEFVFFRSGHDQTSNQSWRPRRHGQQPYIVDFKLFPYEAKKLLKICRAHCQRHRYRQPAIAKLLWGTLHVQVKLMDVTTRHQPVLPFWRTQALVVVSFKRTPFHARERPPRVRRWMELYLEGDDLVGQSGPSRASELQAFRPRRSKEAPPLPSLQNLCAPTGAP